MMSKLIQLYKKRKISIIFLVIAFLLWTLQNLIKSGSTMSAAITFIRLATYFCLILSLYVPFIKAKKYFFTNILMIGILALSIEVICFILLGMPIKERKNFELSNLSENHIAKHLGNIPFKDSVFRDIKKEGNRIIFDVDYTIDSYYKRTTPDYDSTRKNYSIFFGCSIAFGYGLEDNQTLPYYFQEVSYSNAKNYAFRGYGTNNMLARLQFQNLSEQVEEEKGDAFYIFFWDHIDRAIGTMNRYTEWVYGFPYYYLDNGKLVRNKTFLDGRYWTSSFYENVYQTSIVKYFEIDFPIKIKERHYNLITEMVLESKKTYEEQFGNDNFYLVFYPTYKGYTEEELKAFKVFLDEKEIDYIDLSNFVEYGPKYSLDGDPHPNAELNKLLAVELNKRVKELKEKK